MGVAKRDYAQTRDGLKIRYEIRGQGEPLALVMGFSGSGRAWGEPFLQGMERSFTIFVIDNRGTGESDKPDQPWTLADMAADIVSVLDHAKVDRAHIYGISMGGMIAQELALAYPGRVRGLVLGCTNCGVSHSVHAPPEVVANLMPLPGATAEEQARRAFSAACGKAFLNSERGRQVLDQAIADMGKYPMTPVHTFARQGAAIQSFDTHARLGEIKAPTLIIHGDDDAIVPHQNARILAQGITGSRVHTIKGAGHMFFWEAPAESAHVAAEFLETVK